MADAAEPPPLFENIDIKNNEDDDLFSSAVQVNLYDQYKELFFHPQNYLSVFVLCVFQSTSS